MILLAWPFEIPSRPSVMLYRFVYLGTPADKIRKCGIEVMVFDGGANLYTRTDLYQLPWDKIKLVGIVSEPHNFQESVDMLKSVKDLSPNVPCFAFATNATLLGEKILQYGFDYYAKSGIEHDAADQMINLYQSINNIERNNHLQSQITPPAIDLLPYEQYFKIRQKREITVEVARGCRFSCFFCNAWRNYEHSEIYMSLEHLDKFFQTYSQIAQTFGFFAPNLSANRNWFEEFLTLAERHKIAWKFTNAPSLTSSLDFNRLVKSGCYEICMGIETFDSKFLSNINKPIIEKQVLETIKAIRSHGLIAKIYLIFNSTETDEIQEFVHLTEKIRNAGGQIRINRMVDYTKLVEDPVLFSRSRKNNRALFAEGHGIKLPPELLQWQNKIPTGDDLSEEIHEYTYYKRRFSNYVP